MDVSESEDDEWTAISMFAGAGGDTLGMEKAGVNVIAFSENSAQAVKTHLENFPDSKWIGKKYKGDIQKVPDSEILEFKNKVDIVFSGFPCQGHSHAGKKDPKDPRNQLFREFVRVTKLVRPRWIIGENVKGILKRKNKSGDNFVDVISKCFQELGYTIKYKVVKATWYNVPQKRERFIMVGSRDNEEFEIPEGDDQLVPSLRSIIEFDMNGAVQIEEKVVERKKNKVITWVNEPADYKVPEKLKPPHPFLVKNIGLNRISFETRFSSNHGEVVNLDLPSKTIICAYTFQPRLYVGLKRRDGTYWLRTLNTKELQQIQGFPKSFRFMGSVNNVIKQIGNAVPPPIIQKVVSSLL